VGVYVYCRTAIWRCLDDFFCTRLYAKLWPQDCAVGVGLIKIKFAAQRWPLTVVYSRLFVLKLSLTSVGVFTASKRWDPTWRHLFRPALRHPVVSPTHDRCELEARHNTTVFSSARHHQINHSKLVNASPYMQCRSVD